MNQTTTALLSAILQRDTLKTLTMTDPWGTLVALGAKKIETRTWRTEYRGPLALHVAKTVPEEINLLCQRPYFREALSDRARNTQLPLDQRFPLGKVVAIVELEDVRRTELMHPSAQERAFGNYGPHRFAWIFSAVYALQTPVPVRGTLGLWTWTPPPTFFQEVAAGKESIS